jgi:hypothetical protein
MIELFALLLAAATIGVLIYVLKHDATTWRDAIS